MAKHKYHEDEEDTGPSKSALKRESTALQDLGRELAELGKERLARVPIDEDLRDAVKDYQRFTSHEARRRQLQFIGKLMRNVDPEPIRAALDAFKGVSATETAKMHRWKTCAPSCSRTKRPSTASPRPIPAPTCSN
jgi:ribosome-associated protein